MNSWPSGLKRVWQRSQRTWIDLGCIPISVCFSFHFCHLNAKLHHILIEWLHHSDRNGNACILYIELCIKPMGVGLNLTLLIFYSFFSEK